MDGGTTGTPAVCYLPAQEASRDDGSSVQRDNVVPDTNMDIKMDGGTTGTPAVRYLPAREASRDDGSLVR